MARMKEISLKPYPGRVLFCREKAEFERAYKRITGKPHTIEAGVAGRTQEFLANRHKPWTFLVWAPRSDIMAHEFSHVVLQVFHHIDSDPRDGHGEPFCYLLGHLMKEAGAK
jgi:hypothetical protein